MRRIAALAVLMTLVLAAACGGGDDDTVAAGEGDDDTTTTTDTADGTTDTSAPPPSSDTSTTRPGSTTPTTRPPGTTTPPAPTPAAGLAVQIRTGGGFVPIEYNFSNTPEFTLFADGRVIVTGPTTLEYPGKALPNLLEGRVNAQAVTAAIKSARTAGVFGKPDLGSPAVADAPSTTFTAVDGDQKATLDAYALGFDDGPGVSPAQQEARRKLAAFRDEMTNLGAAARDPYKATAVSVLVLPYQAGQGGQEPAPGQAAWPVGNLGTGGIEQYGGRCLGFTGAEAARVLEAAGQARSNTRWQSGGKEWSLSFRLELPGAEPCAPAR